jgi:hypothetical protein
LKAYFLTYPPITVYKNSELGQLPNLRDFTSKLSEPFLINSY